MSYDIDYLTLLSQQYPTVKAASTEIIRLQSRQKLPKLTEHFMSDIHGEYESFLHILKNASGVIKDKITQIYGRTLSERDRQVLATLIYYPEQKLEYIKDEVDDINDWYKITLYRLIEICRVVASKYTRAKIREFLPEAFGSTIDELIHANTDYGSDKESYYNESISTIVELGQADDFIVEISTLIQTLAIGRLHIIGDIFDRGPRADIILDTLTKYHSVNGATMMFSGWVPLRVVWLVLQMCLLFPPSIQTLTVLRTVTELICVRLRYLHLKLMRTIRANALYLEIRIWFIFLSMTKTFGRRYIKLYL